MARKIRVVSARELSRRMANLLDEIEADGSALVIARYGRPSAMLVPFEELGRAPTLPRVADFAGSFTEEIDDVDLDAVRLDDVKIGMLLDMEQCTDLNWVPGRISLPVPERSVALSELEVDRAIERGGGAAWRLTRRGALLVRRLNSSA